MRYSVNREVQFLGDRSGSLAPVGSALIGLRVGQTIRWPMPNDKEKRLKVVSVA